MRKETVLICLSDESVEENKVRINKGKCYYNKNLLI